MGLLGFGKKKEEEKQVSACCCGSAGKAEETSCCCGGTGSGITSVKVLGAGCRSCHEQYENEKEAVRALGLSAEVEYVTDLEKVMGYACGHGGGRLRQRQCGFCESPHGSGTFH